MKLSPFTFILFGICICLVCLTFGYVTWKPNMDETNARNNNRTLAESEYAKEGAAKKRVANTKKLIEAASQRWRGIAQTKTPSSSLATGGVDISRNGAQLMVDSRTFRDSTQIAVNKQLRIGGVRLLGDGPRIPDPGQSAATILADYYNYPAIPFPVVIFDLGTISVTGTYEQIMANVRAWKDMPNYLAVADGLRIEGTSPHMTGTYAVSIVGYVHGTKLFSPLPEVPGSGATGGAGAGLGPGGPGGPPNGMQSGKKQFMFGGANGPKAGGQ